MTRIYDTLRAMAENTNSPFDDNFKQVLKEATVVDITNVVDYLNALDGETDVEMPTVVPPWNIAFYQARSPHHYRRVRSDYKSGPAYFLGSEHYGVIVITYRKPDKSQYSIDEIIETLPDIASQRECIRPCHWLVVAMLFLQDTIQSVGTRICWPINSIFFLGPNGNFAQEQNESLGILTDYGLELIDDLIRAGKREYQREEAYSRLRRIIASHCAHYYFTPVLLANAFAHCKNVKISEMPPEPQRPLKNSQKRRGVQQVPHYSYHVLDIEPMKEVLRTEGQSEKTGLTRALHICRGHFATYTDEKPLFGRVTGTFWKPMHVRGSIKAGIAAKDYNVLKPKKTGV